MKVLVADDDRVSRHMLQERLGQWGYDLSIVADGVAAWEALQGTEGPKLAILDWMMPGLDGLEVCRRLRQRPFPYVYVLVLTAKDRKEDLLAALDAGADDFLAKPWDDAELRARLRTGRRIVELHESLLEAQAALRYEASHDSLTGLHNRQAIMDILRRELERAGRDGSSVGVVLADLDHFKSINDTRGHATGDAVLRETARRLRSSVRPYDGLGRYGGEEFLLVLPGCGPVQVRAMAERLREIVAAEPIREAGDLRLTLSLGVTVGGEGAVSDAERLVAAADAALYRAKQAGRDRVELAGAQDVRAEG